MAMMMMVAMMKMMMTMMMMTMAMMTMTMTTMMMRMIRPDRTPSGTSQCTAQLPIDRVERRRAKPRRRRAFRPSSTVEASL